MLSIIDGEKLIKLREPRPAVNVGLARTTDVTAAERQDNMEEMAGGSISQVAFMLDFTDWMNGPGERSTSGWRFRDLLDALPAAVYTTDADGRITFFNQSAVEFSGRVPEIGSDQW